MSRQRGKRRVDRKIVEFLLQGKGVREICRLLKVGDRRVRRVRAMAEGYGYLSGQTPVPPFPEAVFKEDDPDSGFVSETDKTLNIHKDWMVDRLKAGWSPITVFEELPVGVARSSFYRFLRRHRLDRIGEDARQRLIPEIIHRPGECLQLDWGKLRTVIDEETGKKKTLWAFVGVLGFSRYMMVRLVWSNDIATTLPAIESMFEEIGGVPSRITSDNPKCFALEASKYEPILNPAFERFANHYGCLVELLPPYDPQKKGKVERMMPFVRRLNEAYDNNWEGIEAQQEYINKKVKIANQRRHGSTGLQPQIIFEAEEKPKLKSLPPLSFEREEYHEGKVRKDGFVRFNNKYYAVDEEYRGKNVSIIATKTQVFIYCRGKLIEVHERLTTPYQVKAIKKHQLQPYERIMSDNSYLLKRAGRIGPHFRKIVETIILQDRGFIDTRKIWGLLSLDKTYSHAHMEKAAKRAIKMNMTGYRDMRSLLSLVSVPEETESKKNKTKGGGNKYVRDFSEYKRSVESRTTTQGETL